MFGVIVSSFNYIVWFDSLVLLTVILWLFRHLRFKWWSIPGINVWVNALQLCWDGIQIQYAISNCCFFFTNSVWSSLKYNLHDSIDFSWMSSKQPSDVNMASSKLVMQLAILKFLQLLKWITEICNMTDDVMKCYYWYQSNCSMTESMFATKIKANIVNIYRSVRILTLLKDHKRTRQAFQIFFICHLQLWWNLSESLNCKKENVKCKHFPPPHPLVFFLHLNNVIYLLDLADQKK